MLLEEFRFIESKPQDKGDSLTIEFAFMEADAVNLNKRLYPLPVVIKAVSEATARLGKGASLYGSSSHPKEMLQLNDVSHLITRLWMRDKMAFAESKIIPTTTGKNLAVILRGGGRLGVSARGHGSVEKKGDVDVVKEDYELHSIDFVCSPSFNTYAGLKEETFFESVAFGYGRLSEADLKLRFYRALEAGYKGSFLDYIKKVWKK